jgi:DNA-binding response OmpR family regulator
MARILVVEDELDICNLLRSELEAQGHTVFQAFDGKEALQAADTHDPQLILLDWMLPGLDGLSVCRHIRQNHVVPIIMLTARNEEVDRIMGLEVGADDYISKPFSVREVLARVRAILRRVELEGRRAQMTTPVADPTEVEKSIVRGTLQIKPDERLALLDGVELELTPKEYELLLLLTTYPGRAFSREFLLEKVWGYDYDGFDRTIDTHITRLRKKLGPLGEKIVTVWSVGYRFLR